MARTWTHGQKISGGFAAVVALALLIGGISIYSLQTVVDGKDRVIELDARALIGAEELRSLSEVKTSAGRGFALASAQRFLDTLLAAREEFAATADRMEARLDSNEARRLLGEVRRAAAAHDVAVDRMVDARKGGATIDALNALFDGEVAPKQELLRAALDDFVAHTERELAANVAASTDQASTATLIVIGAVAMALLLSVAISLLLTRALTAQVGAAVQHVQSSSNELQAAANQQATGAKEQATAMAEITTTISELLATSKQIAESAQRVAHIAEETATSARAGERTVQATTDAMSAIRRQVDVIVGHMLELGKKSQQIGGILELINELSDQTNILAINATIEAAGAGEAGKRFSVVADEIRKLADRVGGSTKEIRGLIDEIRTAVNTTVMATEGGSKAVEAGTRQVSDVAVSLGHITGLVGTTTEAAREIELSTKQQSTAVEQVNVAVANVAQATRENEASSNQTLQTASQLTGLSRDLLRLIQPQASA